MACCKKIIIFLLFLFIIFSFPRSSFSATDVIDVESSFQYELELWNVNVLNLMIAHLENNYSDVSVINTFMADMSTGNYFYWIERFSSGRYVLFVYEGTDTSDYTPQNKTLFNSSATFSVDCLGIRPIYWIDFTSDTFRINREDLNTYYCPKPCLGYRPEVLNTFLQHYFYHVDDIDIESVYNAINKNFRLLLDALSNSDSSSVPLLVQIKEGIETSNSILNVISSFNNNNSFNSSDESSVNSDMDSSVSKWTNSTDTTKDAGLDNLFTSFANNFLNSNRNQQVSISIPYTNKTFKFTANDIVGNAPPLLTSYFNMIWYFLLGSFIVKDVMSYIDKMKNGDIIDKSDGNIKTEIL